jgi:hypothetical protein
LAPRHYIFNESAKNFVSIPPLPASLSSFHFAIKLSEAAALLWRERRRVWSKFEREKIRENGGDGEREKIAECSGA